MVAYFWRNDRGCGQPCISHPRTIARPLPNLVPFIFRKTFWANLAEGRSDLWGPGDATFYFLSNKMGYGSGTWFLFVGIKFNPNNIHSTLPLPSAETPAPGKRDDLSEGESEQRGPRVSDAHLAAWFDLWRKVYQGTPLDIEDIAVASARGMFQGKSVTRQQVRDLRGTQKEGTEAKRIPRNNRPLSRFSVKKDI